MRFLLVEDDRALAGAIEQLLLAHHYVMDLAVDGVEGRGMAEVFSYDLILMDWMLPKLDGMQLCQKLREEGNATPIILLTARDASTDRVAGLDAGADDYLVKPFESEELLARIRALLRRSEGIISPVLQWGNLQLDPSSSKVTCRGTPIALTPKEYALLELFLRNPGRIFSLDSLLDKIWPFEDAPTVASVRTHIKGLRQKLKKAGLSGVISTVYGLGYRLQPVPPSTAGATSLDIESTRAIQENGQENQLDLASLWQSVSDSYLQRVAAVADTLRDLHLGRVDQTIRQQLLSEAHALSGSLGSFGFKEVPAQWREIENILRDHDQLSADLLDQMKRSINSIDQSLTQACTTHTPASPVAISSDNSISALPLSTSALAELPSKQLFHLLVVEARCKSAQVKDPHPTWLQTLEEIAVRYQMRVSIASNSEQARNLIFPEDFISSKGSDSSKDSVFPKDSVTWTAPQIVIFNFDGSSELPDNDSADFQLLSELRDLQPPLPTIVLTATASFENRVKVSRVGVDGVLQMPIAPTEIFETAVRILQKGAPPAAKLLVVDDDPSVLRLLRRLLQPWGFQLQMLDDPNRFWQTLENVEPDLVLLDVKMPQISGLDLCRVMRNAPRWHELPILFMSAYTDEQTIQKVFSVGADDYIRKPIVAPELVARVLGWLERSRTRQLRSEVDSLTGVDNRKKSTQSLNRLLGLAQRQGQPLCFALIDIDRFKQINDSYGHPIGDHVLRRFGVCLRSTFRNEDVIARWGGEEFVVGLYGVEAAEGGERLRQFLKTWRQESLALFKELSIENQRLDSSAVTFSAGVAVYPNDAHSLQNLYTAADEALYQAKHAGRNQVRLTAVKA